MQHMSTPRHGDCEVNGKEMKVERLEKQIANEFGQCTDVAVEVRDHTHNT